MIQLVSFFACFLLFILGCLTFVGSSKDLRKDQAHSFSPEGQVRKKLNNLTEKTIGSKRRVDLNLMCKQANVGVRSGEVLFISLILGVFGSIAGFNIFGFVGGVVGFVVGGTIFYQTIKTARNKRINSLSEQVGPTLTIIIKKYQTTEDLAQAFEFAAEEVLEKPMSTELERIKNQIELGMSMEEVLDIWADRMSNKFVDLFAKYAKISTSIGTSKIRMELLSKVSEMHDQYIDTQEEMKKELFATKLTAYILVSIIPGFILFKIATDDAYLDFMTGTFAGQAVLLFAITMMALSTWVINAKIAAPLDD